MMGLFRRTRRVGTGPAPGNPGNPGRDLWPVLALLVTMAVVPSACVLWFLSRAVGSERLAVRQRLAEVYRRQLSPAPEWARQWWDERRGELTMPPSLAAAEVFRACLDRPMFDAVVVLDENGSFAYPQLRPDLGRDDPSPAWLEAERLEFQQHDYALALKAYEQIQAGGAKPDNLAQIARTLIPRIRCLIHVGRRGEAMDLISESLDSAKGAADDQGRLIAPNALLLGFQTAPPDTPEHAELLSRLVAMVDYRVTPSMPAFQRRFLLSELLSATDRPELRRWLTAEELADEYLHKRLEADADGPAPSGVKGVWRVASSDHRMVGLIRQDHLVDQFGPWLSGKLGLTGTTLDLLPPGASQDPDALAWVAMDDFLPGWQLSLRLEGDSLFAAAAHRQELVLVWVGILALLAIGVATAAAGYALQKQVRLARLKNDLIANVSHELKTPLAGMRVLIDTLVDGRCRDERQAAEYLGLIARENTRLCRLIDNFLAFSRMERNKQAFVMEPVAVADVIDAAVQSVHERIEASGGALTVEVDEHLPGVVGDRDALTTAVLNLLDNALKYSGQDKRIHVRARDLGLDVGIEVTDHGVGIPRRAVRRVFERFYQVDQRLSRTAGGCGLGLSVVRFIMTAHGGTVEVRSVEGQGSTFQLRLPKKSTMDLGQG
ncbi:MAG: HAMP domain-containing histidine kinase [Phycisphaeraceae bacterium]|nr:HAMP domain-containing histidine kinase [Phycisphaeraceae bacterium]